MARPKEYTPERIEQILINLDLYIAQTDIPIVAEFAYKNEIPRQTLYELEPLRDTIKRLIDKKEANLERGMLDPANKGSVSGFIFSLKQLGWKDKTEIEHSGSIKTINIDEKIDQIEKNLNDNTDD